MTDLVRLTTVKDQQWFDLETITNKGAWNEATLVAMNRRLPNQSAKAVTREAALRITSGALPSVPAMLITRRGYKQMRDPALISQYQASKSWVDLLSKNKNSNRNAFNGVFDEGVMRLILWRNAQDPYLGSRDGRGSQDARDILLWSGILSQIGMGIHLPQNVQGKFSSKLQDIAEAHGLDTSHAHVSAAADVDNMRELVETAWRLCPDLQTASYFCQHKDQLRQLAQHENFFLQASFSTTSGPSFVVKSVIGQHPLYSNQDLCIDLRGRGQVSEGSVGTEAPRNNGCGFSKLKCNTGPILVFKGKIMDLLLTRQEQARYSELAQLARGDAALLERARAYYVDKVSQYEKPKYPEQQMVSGGFVNDRDRKIADRFHAASPEDKFGFIAQMADERLRYFAERVLYENWPQSLPVELLRKIDDEIAWKLTTNDDVPWQTIHSARIEIEAELPNCTGQQADLLLEYQEDLLHLEHNPIPRLNP